MRSPAVLILATLLFFSIELVHGQSPQDQQRPKEPQVSKKAKDAEKSQGQENQQNPFDAFQQFSANMNGGPLHFDNLKVYRLGNKFRADWEYEHEVRISDLATRGSSFMRRSPNKPEECFSGDLMDIASYPFFAYTASDFSVERSATHEAEEKETIEGHPAKVENYIVTQKGTGRLTARVKLWEAEDLSGFPIRMDIDPATGKKFTLSYTNVSVEKPDPKLFRVPAKCPKDKDGTSPVPVAKPSHTTRAKPDGKGPSSPQ